MATSGENYWPPTGRTSWPLTGCAVDDGGFEGEFHSCAKVGVLGNQGHWDDRKGSRNGRYEWTVTEAHHRSYPGSSTGCRHVSLQSTRVTVRIECQEQGR